jgi:hypothetical protein
MICKTIAKTNYGYFDIPLLNDDYLLFFPIPEIWAKGVASHYGPLWHWLGTSASHGLLLFGQD